MVEKQQHPGGSEHLLYKFEQGNGVIAYSWQLRAFLIYVWKGRWGYGIQLNREAGLANLVRSNLCVCGGGQSSNHKHLGKENKGEYFLHAPSTFTLMPEEDFCPLSEPHLRKKALLLPWSWSIEFLNMAVPVSTTHIHSGLHSLPMLSYCLESSWMNERTNKQMDKLW